MTEKPQDPRSQPVEEDANTISVWNGVPAFLFFVFIFTPAVVLLISTIFGGLLSGIEGWSFHDGTGRRTRCCFLEVFGNSSWSSQQHPTLIRKREGPWRKGSIT